MKKRNGLRGEAVDIGQFLVGSRREDIEGRAQGWRRRRVEWFLWMRDGEKQRQPGKE